MICHPNNSDNDDDDSNNTQSQATASSTQSATEQKKEAKKKSKSNFLLYLVTSQNLDKILNLNNTYINLLWILFGTFVTLQHVSLLCKKWRF